MARELIVSGFNVHIGKAFLCRIKKKDSIYDGALMVAVPFTIHNRGTTTRSFANSDYYYIVQGKTDMFHIKADQGFNDSLINLKVKAKKDGTGFIRIPYDEKGQYGIVIRHGKEKVFRTFSWYFDKETIVFTPINKDRNVLKITRKPTK